MKNIILLIQKYRNFIFFLILETIALFFLFNNTNNYHHFSYLSSSNRISAGLHHFQYNLKTYFSLKEINEELLKENAYLKNKLLNKDMVVGQKFLKVNDTTFKKNFLFKEVKIINSQFKFYKNNLIINSGTKSGVAIKMGLIGTKGILGIVTNTSDNYATVRPVINPDFGLKVIHKLTNSWGDLQWIPEKNNFNNVFIKNIPIYTEVEENNIFITSGAEGIFPRGIKVGRVIKVLKNVEKQTLLVKLKLEEDFSRLNVGFILKNNSQEELNYHLKKK